MRLPTRSNRQASHVIGALAAVLVVLTLAAAGLLIWDQRNAVVRNTQQDLTDLGIVLAEQTGRLLQGVDLVLRDIDTELTGHAITRSEQMKEQLANRSVHDLLADQQKYLPQADSLGLFDASGNLVNLSRVWPPPRLNIADRDYFHALRDHPEI